VSERRIHFVLDEESMFVFRVRSACARYVKPFEGYATHRGTVTCVACQPYVRHEGNCCFPRHEDWTLAGVVRDAKGWRVVLRGEVVLTTEDEGYALRALKRTIERELVKVRT
jgi:hypothetical protein